jgi:hypothetical protein
MARRPLKGETDASKKPPPRGEVAAPQSAEGTVGSLHIAVSQRIVGLHNYNSRMSLDTVRDEIERLARDAGTEMESKDRAHLREHLERATGLTIAELAERGGSGCWNTELASISGALRV